MSYLEKLRVRARNPELSASELLELCEDAPHEVLANPALLLLGLEDPRTIKKVIYYAELYVALERVRSWYLPMESGDGNGDGDSSGSSPLWGHSLLMPSFFGEQAIRERKIVTRDDIEDQHDEAFYRSSRRKSCALGWAP